MYARLNAVLDQIPGGLASDLSTADRQLARRLALEFTRYGAGALPDELFDGPSGRKLARMAAEDIEGVRRMAGCFRDRQVVVTVEEEIEEPTAEEGAKPVKKTVQREETRSRPPRVIEINGEGHGMISLVLGLTFPDTTFQVAENHEQRRWLWQRMGLSFGLRNVELLPIHARISPGEWDVVLVKDVSPVRAMDLAGSLLAPGGTLLFWHRTESATGLRRRHLDSRSRPLRLEHAVALESPLATGRLVACIRSEDGELDAPDAAA